MIHLRLPSLPKLVLFVVGMLLVADWVKEDCAKTGANEPKSKKKSKDKEKKRKAEEADNDDEKDVEGDAVDDE